MVYEKKFYNKCFKCISSAMKTFLLYVHLSQSFEGHRILNKPEIIPVSKELLSISNNSILFNDPFRILFLLSYRDFFTIAVSLLSNNNGHLVLTILLDKDKPIETLLRVLCCLVQLSITEKFTSNLLAQIRS